MFDNIKVWQSKNLRFKNKDLSKSSIIILLKFVHCQELLFHWAMLVKGLIFSTSILYLLRKLQLASLEWTFIDPEKFDEGFQVLLPKLMAELKYQQKEGISFITQINIVLKFGLILVGVVNVFITIFQLICVYGLILWWKDLLLYASYIFYIEYIVPGQNSFMN